MIEQAHLPSYSEDQVCNYTLKYFFQSYEMQLIRSPRHMVNAVRRWAENLHR